jgi:hypothetical protein
MFVAHGKHSQSQHVSIDIKNYEWDAIEYGKFPNNLPLRN